MVNRIDVGAVAAAKARSVRNIVCRTFRVDRGGVGRRRGIVELSEQIDGILSVCNAVTEVVYHDTASAVGYIESAIACNKESALRPVQRRLRCNGV